MDNYEALLCVLQMAKAYQAQESDAGYDVNHYDAEAIIRVEAMLEFNREEKVA